MNAIILNYIIRSGLGLVLLYLFFIAFLSRERFYRFNRFYLLFSLAFSFLAPLLTLPVFIFHSPVINTSGTAGLQEGILQMQAITHQTGKQPDIEWIINTVYFTVSSVLLIRFLLNLIFLRIRKSSQPPATYEGYKVILINDPVLPYSFLSTIYVNSEEYMGGHIPNELLSHEISHIAQRHSIDVIFIELLKIFFWFNPLLFFFKKAIMLNHEYLADEAVTKTKINYKSYIDIILRIAFRNNNSYLASSFNYSFTKKRLLMMTKNNFSKAAIFKKIAVIPLFLAVGLIVINAQEVKSVKTNVASPPPPPGFFNFGKPPLVLLDGVVSDIDLNKIDMEKMQAVVVYKDDTAVKKFGEKGKNGVVELTSRKEDSPYSEKETVYAEIRSTSSDPGVAEKPYVMVEEMPEFPGGGDDAMRSWISRNLQYPPEALKQKIEGTATVRFYINTQGKPQDIVVLKSDSPLFNNEAKRIIGSMPDWKPGKQGGKPVDVYKMVSVNFILK